MEAVSLIHHSLCHICFSRSPTQSGPPHLSLPARAAGHSAGCTAEQLSAESWPAGLEGPEHCTVALCICKIHHISSYHVEKMAS